jgi:hypothetical protein
MEISMRQWAIFGSILILVGIFVLFHRFEIVAAGESAWRLDRFTGSIARCGSKSDHCYTLQN